jgi:nucleoside-diphosphate-sugar epimerase
MTHPIIILGTGYSGRHLTNALTAISRPFFATSREPDKNLIQVSTGRRIKFDLEQPSTWPNIPGGTDLIWCFPATPLSRVQQWAETQRSRFNCLVVLGSTSAYEIPDQSAEYPPHWINEDAPIDLSKSRVQGEEYLREHHGGIVLRVAGIYGPRRNPLDWIRQGRVGPSRKYVNLIHVEDLAAICLAAIEKGKPGEIYNVSDGTPHLWSEICATAQKRWGVAVTAAKKDLSSGKRISIAKLRTELGYVLRHPNLYETLAMIESGNEVETQDGQNDFQQGPRRGGSGSIPSGGN